MIDDGYAHTDLPERWKLAVGLADIVLGERPADHDLATALHGEFSDAELAELTLTVAMAVGFSKSAIAWGPEPDLPTMSVPTPGS